MTLYLCNYNTDSLISLTSLTLDHFMSVTGIFPLCQANSFIKSWILKCLTCWKEIKRELSLLNLTTQDLILTSPPTNEQRAMASDTST